MVDDNSTEDTKQIISELQAGLSDDFLRFHVRVAEKGLSSAVLKGFSIARGHNLICMDADGQHPVEAVPKLIAALRYYEFVIGTRKGGSVQESWSKMRRTISTLATVAVLRVTAMSDPMTGMFGITRKALERGLPHVNPRGFKIALELYVKCGIRDHWEIPISFGVRTAGENKLSSTVVLQYLCQIVLLYIYIFCTSFLNKAF